MNIPLKIFFSQTTDPWFNLALEDWLFQEYGDTHHVLYLWRNDKTVVIGRAQNPWLECHLPAMEKAQVKLARRQSGGGTVFHDLGNTNFTFISPKAAYDKNRNLALICQALAEFGIQAYASGRNDILVDLAPDDPRKISGSAFRETKTKCFHHGTLLLHANLTELSHYLNPSPKKLIAKGVKSVRSRVMNLAELYAPLNHERICQAISQHFMTHFRQSASVEHLNLDQGTLPDSLQSHYSLLKSWEWRFGRTLPFTHELHERFEFGEMRLHFVVNGAKISDCICYTDCLTPEPFQTLAQAFIGRNYHAGELCQAIPLALEPRELLKSWLLTEIP